MARRAATSAESLHCPNCGAAVSCDSTQCKYCKAKLATVGCPSCFGMAFLGSKHCPHCGAALTASKPSVPTVLLCPRCNVKMLATTLKDTQLLECGKCSGLWIDSQSFSQVCSDREKLAGLPDWFMKPARTKFVEEAPKYLACPVCMQLMNRYNFARVSGIIIDICRKHGVWFDRDELARIVDFIRAGGMTKSREHEKRSLKAERERLELEQRTRTQDSGSLIGPLNEPSQDLLVDAFSLAGRVLHSVLKTRR